jgi:hypothetical protein
LLSSRQKSIIGTDVQNIWENNKKEGPVFLLTLSNTSADIASLGWKVSNLKNFELQLFNIRRL